jgi:predicted glycosyltransferase
LIVRREFLGEATSSTRQNVGILLSGSELEKAAFMELAVKFGLKVFSPNVSTVPSRASELDDFEVVFTQGGLSSISECLARDKFLVVFPLSHHPEQLLNAMEVEQLGLGLASRLEELNHFPELLERIRETKRREVRVDCTGADVAAGFIFEALNSDPSQTSIPY